MGAPQVCHISAQPVALAQGALCAPQCGCCPHLHPRDPLRPHCQDIQGLRGPTPVGTQKLGHPWHPIAPQYPPLQYPYAEGSHPHGTPSSWVPQKLGHPITRAPHHRGTPPLWYPGAEGSPHESTPASWVPKNWSILLPWHPTPEIPHPQGPPCRPLSVPPAPGIACGVTPGPAVPPGAA